jgi:hypothetical protein
LIVAALLGVAMAAGSISARGVFELIKLTRVARSNARRVMTKQKAR